MHLAFLLTLVLAACASDDAAPTPDAVGDLPPGDVAPTPDAVGDLPAGDAGDVLVLDDGFGEGGEGDLAAEATADPGLEMPVTPDVFAPALSTALQAVLDDYIRFSGDPGIAFAIRDGDKRQWTGVAGVSDLVAKTPVTVENRFRVGSNTKPITATWILQLVEEGLVDLDVPLTTYLPEYPQWSAITVRDLLGMQSGIPEYITDTTLLIQVLSDPAHVYTPAEVLGFVKDKALLFTPGTGGAYSNSDYVLLGLIGEKVTGKKARDQFQERFFTPLGLTHTVLEQAGDPTDQLMHGYMDLSVLVPLLKLPSAMFAVIPESLYVNGTQTIDATNLLHPSLTWTAGAIVSTPADLATFQRVLQRGELLGPDMMTQMHTFHTITLLGGSVDYGLGLMRQQTPLGVLYGHGGLNFGFHVETYYQPDLDVAFCHMHNYLPAQTVAVTSGVVGTYLSAGKDALDACAVPDGMFAGVEDATDPYVKMLFKGKVGDAAKLAEAEAGMSSAWVTQGLAWNRLAGLDRVGIFSSALISTTLGSKRLNVNAWGKGPEGDNWLEEVVLNLDPAMLAQTAAGREVNLLETDGYNASVALVDIELYPDLKGKKSCVVAVPDFAKKSSLYVCPGGANPPAFDVGVTTRFAARLGLTTDTAKIDAYLVPVGLTRCSCLDETGAAMTCP